MVPTESVCISIAIEKVHKLEYEKLPLKILRDTGMSEKAQKLVLTSQYFGPSHYFEDQKS